MQLVKMKFTFRPSNPSVGTVLNRRVDEALVQVGKLIRSTAVKSIKTRSSSAKGKFRGSAPPGTPIRTKQGLARRSIRFAVDKNEKEVVVGTVFSLFNVIGKVHEFGGQFRGKNYPARPFMRPALDKSLPVIASKFKNIL